MVSLPRLLRHIGTTRWQLRRAFPASAQEQIRRAVERSERAHTGHVRFAVESALHGGPLLHGQTPQARALDMFGLLRVWDTEHNNGVLIYVLLADRAVEIVADRGIASRVPAGCWDTICRQMEIAFRQGDYASGALAGIGAVCDCLAQHYACEGGATPVQ